ncbi:Uncharacterised protein [Staphylococcus aureus]|nr:Uncharacterised protein [Staphylococcus aureus]
MTVIAPTIPVIKIGAKIRHVIPLTNITPAIIAANTNVVPRSFCSNIKILGTNETPIILKNNNKSLWNDLLNVN